MSASSHLRNASKNHIRLTALGQNLLLLVVWGWLFRPIFPYFHMIATRQDFRTNQIAIALLLAIFIYKAIEDKVSFDFTRQPKPRAVPLAICLIATIAFIITERLLDINTIGSVLFVLSTYGLLGLYLNPQTWRNGLPVALLIAGTIPINNHLQTFVGYPMRIASAAIIRDALAAAGVGSYGVNTILIFENGVAHVDIPCSGAQSLWTGAMFLTTATWLEHKRLGLRWLMTAGMLAVLLFAANLMRIGLLVLSGQVMGWTSLAGMLHVPLGVLGFIGACLVALWLLREWVPSTKVPTSILSPAAGDRSQTGQFVGSARSLNVATPRAVIETRTKNKRFYFLPPLRREKVAIRGFFPFLLIATLLLLSLFHQPYVRANTIASSSGWTFPTALQTESQPLDAAQLDWLLNDGADAADRFRFEHGALSGSMLFVVASNWHAHHFPEGCFTGLGLSTQDSHTELVHDQFPVRWLTMTAPDGTPYSAVYWFQSAEIITDDYATRIWDDLRFERNQWVLVSALFDGPVEFDSAETHVFLNDLRNTIKSE